MARTKVWQRDNGVFQINFPFEAQWVQIGSLNGGDTLLRTRVQMQFLQPYPVEEGEVYQTCVYQTMNVAAAIAYAQGDPPAFPLSYYETDADWIYVSGVSFEDMGCYYDEFLNGPTVNYTNTVETRCISTKSMRKTADENSGGVQLVVDASPYNPDINVNFAPTISWWSEVLILQAP